MTVCAVLQTLGFMYMQQNGQDWVALGVCVCVVYVSVGECVSECVSECECVSVGERVSVRVRVCICGVCVSVIVGV